VYWRFGCISEYTQKSNLNVSAVGGLLLDKVVRAFIPPCLCLAIPRRQVV